MWFGNTVNCTIVGMMKETHNFVYHQSNESPFYDLFTQSTEDELHQLIIHVSGNSKSCMIDPIATTLRKASRDVLLPIPTKIVNQSITTSTVSSNIKKAVVFPLIKKIMLYMEDVCNYHHVSNLPLMEKVTEKIVFNQMNSQMTINTLYELFQSTYREEQNTHRCALCMQ